MERLEAFNPQRLQWCITDAQVGIGDLAHSVGISERTLSRAIEGEIGLTYLQLQKLGVSLQGVGQEKVAPSQ